MCVKSQSSTCSHALTASINDVPVGQTESRGVRLGSGLPQTRLGSLERRRRAAARLWSES